MNDLQKLTDEQLVNLYLSDVNEAFDTLLHRYKDRIYSYILFSIKNQDLADDLFQETFVKAIVQIRSGKYVDTGKFYAWLTRIAHNLIIDQYRAERNENVMSNDEAEGHLFEQVRLYESSRESYLISEQSLEQVRDLIEFLPQNQKEVVKMRFYQDLSFKEISELTGVSINTSLGRMRYAILNMRKMATDHHIYLESE